MSTMSAQITAFVDTTNIFDVVQKKDRKKISQNVTVPHLKGICNVIISLTSVPKRLKIAHRKFIQDFPKGEKGPLQAMLLPVSVATAAAQDAAASTSPCCLYLINAISVALPEDDETTEEIGTGSGGSGKRPRTTVSPSVAPAATDSTDSTDSTTVPAPALSSGTATSAGAFSTSSPSSSLASGRVGRGPPLKNEMQVGANIAFDFVGALISLFALLFLLAQIVPDVIDLSCLSSSDDEDSSTESLDTCDSPNVAVKLESVDIIRRSCKGRHANFFRDDSRFQVHSIVDVKMVFGSDCVGVVAPHYLYIPMFRVRWNDPYTAEDDTWEPVDDLLDLQVFAAFMRSDTWVAFVKENVDAVKGWERIRQ
eukprot:gene32596-biopygen11955